MKNRHETDTSGGTSPSCRAMAYHENPQKNTTMSNSNMNQNLFSTINKKQQRRLLQSTSSKKYQAIILLMLDCGLRVSELIELQCQHILFSENKIVVVSSSKSRKVPMTQRLMKSLADYWQLLVETNPNSYLFPAGKNSKSPHIGRKQIWKIINQLSKGNANPTILRNTFAARVAKENDLSVAKELLGDSSISVTEKHIEILEEEKESAIQSIEQTDFITKLYRKFFPNQNIHIIPSEIGLTKFHIGRKEELQKLYEYGKKKVNLLITGEQGVGKSHLLDNYNFGNLIRIGDLSTTKRMVAGLLLHLFETDKESIAKTLYEKQLNKNDIGTLVYRETIKRMTEMLIQITEQHEYTLLIDDVTRGSAGNGERMAYLFDTRRVQLSGLACELVVPKEQLKKIGADALQQQFVRTPYAVGFRSRHQTCILVTLHVKYGKKAKERQPELKAIAARFSAL